MHFNIPAFDSNTCSNNTCIHAYVHACIQRNKHSHIQAFPHVGNSGRAARLRMHVKTEQSRHTHKETYYTHCRSKYKHTHLHTCTHAYIHTNIPTQIRTYIHANRNTYIHAYLNTYLRGGTRKVGKQERNRRKNEGERAGKKT